MATRQEKELLTKLDKNFQSALQHPTWQNFAKHAKIDFEFRENKQWTGEEEKELEKRGQAATTENEINVVVKRLNGAHKRQKTRIMFRGRNVGPDESAANVLSDLALHAQQNSGYEFEEGDMFDDGNVSGFGVMECKIIMGDDLEPTIKLEAEDVLNVFPDPNTKKYNWNQDANHISRAKWTSLEEAQELYPHKKKELKAFINLDPVQNETSNFRKDNYIDSKSERVRLVEQWYKERKREQIIFKDGETEDVSELSDAKVKKMLAGGGQLIPRVKTEMKMAVFVGDVLLESKDSPYDHGLFPFVPFFVYRKKDGEPYSDIRLLIDPQREINKRRSKALHLLSTNQVVFEEGAIQDRDELAREMAKPDGQIVYKKGRKLEIIKNIEVASSQIALHAESKAAVTRISGVSNESLARGSEIRSGIGLQRKQMEQSILLLPIFDNLRRTRLMIGDLIFGLIKQYYTSERVFSVTDDQNMSRQIDFTQEHIETIKDGIYDMIIEETPDTTTIQDEQFVMIRDMLNGLNLPPNYVAALLPIVLSLSQIRGKEEVMKQIQELGQPGPEHPKMVMNLVWSELSPEEKAGFARLNGWEELALFELEAGDQAAHVTKEEGSTLRKQMEVEGKLQETDIKEEGQFARNVQEDLLEEDSEFGR